MNNKENIKGFFRLLNFCIILFGLMIMGSSCVWVDPPNSSIDNTLPGSGTETSPVITTPPAVPTVDTTAPGVISINPNDNQTNVYTYPSNGEIYAIFSEAIDANALDKDLRSDTAYFTIVDEKTGKRMGGTMGYDPLKIAAYFLPYPSILPYNTTFIATIKHNSIKDLAGNVMIADKVWKFTTEAEQNHILYPFVQSWTPGGGAQVSASDPNITVTFSAPMDTEIIRTTNDPSNFFSLTNLGKSGPNVSGTFTYDDISNTGKFIPLYDLLPNTKYMATVIAKDIKDRQGNKMQSDFVWYFTTVSK